ncbi:DUF6776 family protein [uncultured Acinetobacter sp.]|uniref:DUF6776 family protein n=1 Tax=uncultured Acinetobacter sp. TaxID=165433 RepID=UPI002612C350|nr:DUF6776 family protein [uncultured Acinetobacter sp.]
MQDTDSNTTTPKPMLQGNLPLVIGAAILMLGSGFLAYSVGHRQGLTVTGYDADAEQLVDVVQKQKASLEALNKSLNAAIQERDVAVTNSNDLYNALNQAKANQQQAEGMNAIYREVLKQRGGLSLTIQNLGIKSLPENVYEYQIDLVQVSPNNLRAVGNVELRLIQGTEVLSVPLEATQFGFEHFERLTGRWTMPKGFSPQFIEVRLTGSTPVTKRFGWSRGQAIESPSAFVSEIPQVEANAQ